jgi:hypothetical protein
LAASVVGTFTLIDRASGPMKRMENQAERTDKAIRSAGDALDDIGTSKQLHQMEATERQIRDVGREQRTTTRTTRDLGSSWNRFGRDSDRLGDKLFRLGGILTGIQKAFMALKLPVIAAGIVALVQAVGALAGGAVALLPKVLDLGGALGGVLTPLVGMGVAGATVTLAFKGLGDAIGGDAEAMKKLTPEARKFVNVVKEMRPVGRGIQRAAAGGLLPGLGDALQQLRRGAPLARRLVGGMGRELGGVAQRAAGAFTEPGFLRDFEKLGRQGTSIMGKLGDALINVVQALRHVAVEARPFTNWLTNTILRWTEGWKESAKLGRETGRLERYFNRAKQALRLFGRIAENLWDTFRGLGRAARPLGEDLWRSADRATKRWADFTNSVTGQAELRNYFNSLKEPLHAMFGLVGDIGKALFRLSDEPGLTQVLESLRGAVPYIESLFRNIGSTLGPALADVLVQIIRLIDNLFGAGGLGPVTPVLKAFEMILNVVNILLEKIPGLASLLSFGIAVLAIDRLLAKFGQMIAGLGGVTAAATRANAAMAGMGAGAMAAPGFFGGPLGRRARGVPTPGGRGRVPGTVGGGVAGGVGMASPAAWGYGAAAAGGAAGRLRDIPGRVRGFFAPQGPQAAIRPLAGGPAAAVEAGASRSMTALNTLGRGLGGFARAAWPVAAFFAATGAITTPGGPGQRLKGALSQATMGIVPPPPTKDENIQKGREEAMGWLKELPQAPTTERAARGPIAEINRRLAGMEREEVTAPWYKQTGASIIGIGEPHKELESEAEFQARRAQIGAAKQPYIQQAQVAGSAEGTRVAADFQKAFTIRLRQGETPAKALATEIQHMPDQLKKLGPTGQMVMQQNMLSWAQGLAKQSPELRKIVDKMGDQIERRYRRMGKHVEVVNGRILQGTQKEWKGIHRAITTEAEAARQEASKAFTDLQREAVGSLVAMGYDRAGAKAYIAGRESGQVPARADPATAIVGGHLDPHFTRPRGGGRGKPGKRGRGGAQGGRIGGTTRQDVVPIEGMAAPGELIVNQHTEQRLDRMLGLYGTSLGREVAGESRRHSEAVERNAARGGRTARNRPATGVGPGATGGMSAALALARRLGLSASEGPGTPSGVPSSGHASGSLHYSGLAYDVSGSAAAMRRYFMKALRQLTGINELFYDPMGYYIDEGSRHAGQMGGHSDHVHIGFFASGAGGGGALAGGAGTAGVAPVPVPKLGRRRTKLRGLPGAASQAAMDLTRGALQKRLNKAGGAGAPGGAGAVGGGVNAWLTQALQITGQYSRANLRLLRGRAMQESGGDPNAINRWDSNAAAGNPSQGLLQTIPSTFNAYKLPGYNQITNPVHNAIAAIRYMMARYGHIVGPGGGGYAKGGRVPFAGWYAGGGSLTAGRPTLVGVGDGPVPERVSVRPVGSRGGGGGVTIQSMKIENHRPGDVRRQIKREVNQAFDELGRELAVGPDGSERS